MCLPVQDLEQQQLASHQRQLAEAHAAADAARSAHDQLRDGFLQLHASLSPTNLAVLFGEAGLGGGLASSGGGGLVGGAGASEGGAGAGAGAAALQLEEYEELTERLAAAEQLDPSDVILVLQRHAQTLAQVRVAGSADGCGWVIVAADVAMRACRGEGLALTGL